MIKIDYLTSIKFIGMYIGSKELNYDYIRELNYLTDNDIDELTNSTGKLNKLDIDKYDEFIFNKRIY